MARPGRDGQFAVDGVLALVVLRVDAGKRTAVGVETDLDAGGLGVALRDLEIRRAEGRARERAREAEVHLVELAAEVGPRRELAPLAVVGDDPDLAVWQELAAHLALLERRVVACDVGFARERVHHHEPQLLVHAAELAVRQQASHVAPRPGLEGVGFRIIGGFIEIRFNCAIPHPDSSIVPASGSAEKNAHAVRHRHGLAAGNVDIETPSRSVMHAQPIAVHVETADRKAEMLRHEVQPVRAGDGEKRVSVQKRHDIAPDGIAHAGIRGRGVDAGAAATVDDSLFPVCADDTAEEDCRTRVFVVGRRNSCRSAIRERNAVREIGANGRAGLGITIAISEMAITHFAAGALPEGVISIPGRDGILARIVLERKKSCVDFLRVAIGCRIVGSDMSGIIIKRNHSEAVCRIAPRPERNGMGRAPFPHGSAFLSQSHRRTGEHDVRAEGRFEIPFVGQAADGRLVVLDLAVGYDCLDVVVNGRGRPFVGRVDFRDGVK